MLADFRNNLTAEEEIRLANNFLIDLPGEDLAQPMVLEAWQKRAWVGVAYSLSLFAHKLLQKLKQGLLVVKESIAQDYQEIIIWLYYASFDDLSQDELVDFFREYDFTLILRDEDSNLVAKLKLRLALEPLEGRDLWREKIYNAMHENNIAVTKGFITTGGRGAIANWLKEYDKEIGIDVAETIKRVEFESRPDIQKNLDVNDKNNLKKLLDFYEFIKISSFDPAGFEDSLVVALGGKEYLVADGKQIDLAEVESELKRSGGGGAGRIIPEEPKIKSETAMAKQMPPFQSVAGEAKRLLISTQGQVSAVLLALNKALNEQRATEALGALLLLAQLRRLDDLLADDARFRELVAADLKNSGADDKVEGLRLNPTAPNFIARLLKVVLQDKLNLAEAEALGFSQKLSGLLALEGEKYGRIVIEDGKGGRKWNL